jgi:hypothetical protein
VAVVGLVSQHYFPEEYIESRKDTTKRDIILGKWQFHCHTAGHSGLPVYAVSRHGERWSIMAPVTELSGRGTVRRVQAIDAPSWLPPSRRSLQRPGSLTGASNENGCRVVTLRPRSRP